MKSAKYFIFLFLIVPYFFVFASPLQAALPGDTNSDNKVDGLDYVVWLNNYDSTSNYPTITEPVNNSPTPPVNVNFLPAFPGAEGFGAVAMGGRGGTVIKVTNLSDSGSGSFRACAEATGPRNCIFEVSGTISLADKVSIKNPNLTIAGESSPSPGITLKGAPIEIKTSDIIIRHIRIRVGNQSPVSPSDLDGMAILGPNSKKIIIDHVSISWAVDENLNTWYDGVTDVTISNSIISEALDNSTHPEGPHSKGFLIGDYAKKVALINSVFAHNYDRHPFLKGGTSSVVLNNLFYNFGQPYGTRLGSTDSSSAGPILTTIQGNIYIKGPDTSSSSDAVSLSTAASGSQWYVNDNKMENVRAGLATNTQTRPIWFELLTPDPSTNIENQLLLGAGSRPKDRDSVDNRVITEIKNRSGRIIDNPSDVGGWPTLAQNTRAFPVPANPNADDDSDGYTNLEELLHQYASQLSGL